MTNPTPTTREREAAREIAYNLEYQSNGVNNPDVIDLGKLELSIAAALARERREALTEAARLTCWACANDVQYVDGMHQHPQTGEWVNCKAIAINRELRAIERLRDGEKG